MRSSLIGVVKVNDVPEEICIGGFKLEEAITCKHSESDTKLKIILCLVKEKISKALERKSID